MKTFMSISNCCIVLLAIQASACGQHGTPTTPTPAALASPAVTTIRIDGPATIAPGATARFTATGRHADGTSEDVTTAALWLVYSVPPLLQPAASVLQIVGPGTARAGTRGEVAVLAKLPSAISDPFDVLVLEPGTFKVSGTVTAQGGDPITTAAIDILSGTGTGLSTTTNLDGRYALYGAAGVVELRASANGFEPQTHRIAATDSIADDFGLKPLVTPIDVSGAWTVTLSASPSCRGSLPEVARDRAFEATITQQSSSLRIVLTSATSNCRCSSSNPGRILGPAFSFTINAQTPDFAPPTFLVPCLVDSLTPTESLGIYGTVSGTVTGSQIQATLDGSLDYYRSAEPVGVPPTQCSAHDHVMTFRRR